MGLMNFLKNKNKQEQANTGATGSDWDNLQEVPFNDETVKNPEAREYADKLSRQEKKLANVILYNNPKLFAEAVPDLTNESVLTVYDKLNFGQFDEQAQKEALLWIKTYTQKTPDMVLNDISESEGEAMLLSYFTDASLENLQPASIDTFLQKYPTPADFEAEEQELLKQARGANFSPEAFAKYSADITEFKQKIYGKRQEYYDTLKSLKEKAKENQLVPEKVDVFYVNDAERREFLDNGVVEGDPYLWGGSEYQLVPGALEELGLAPEYKVSVANAEIAFSKVYEVNADRPAVTAYVKTEKGIKICTYYRSNSQGVWRLLPDYIPPFPEKPAGYCGKGYSEESLNLPTEIQSALETVNGQPHAKLEEVQSRFAFFGTAKRYDNVKDYLDAQQKHTFRGDFYKETSHEPILNLGHTLDKPNPDTLALEGNIGPDFTMRSDYTYENYHNIYGLVAYEHFPSEDKKYVYTMNHDTQGRVWLGGIEARTKLNSYGLHTEWVSPGAYATPLYEYDNQTGGYGDNTDMRGGYVCMWNNYLSKTPLIQRYLNSVNNMWKDD